MSPTFWTEVAPSQFPWEREALDFLREGLPDYEPFRAWSNFEFVADDGTINEVDCLVLTPRGLFLVEIKSQRGVLTGDSQTWTWKHEGKRQTVDNPLILANRKAKKLRSVLDRQRACKKKGKAPFIEALVFCSARDFDCKLDGLALTRICGRDREDRPGILAALLRRQAPGLLERRDLRIDKPTAKMVSRALEEAGIRPSQRARRVGDFQLKGLLFESPTGAYQDWRAEHVTLPKVERRIRIYSVAHGTSEEEREHLRRAAEREFRLLEPLDHPGILTAESYTQHELGPALIFRHHPKAQRLDLVLAERGAKLSLDQRIQWLRRLSEALRYAHEKRVVHRALCPQSVLVLDPEASDSALQIFNWQVGYRAPGASGTTEGVTATIHAEQLVEDASMVYLAPEARHAGAELGAHVDVFSLGAIAYHLYAGEPPATSALALVQRLREERGLQLSATLDGPSRELEDLIQYSTHPDVGQRYGSVEEFLEQLDLVVEELTRPQEDSVPPLDAKRGDRLEGGFVVKNRLGSGSSAVALLVEHQGRELVLKIASRTEHNERVQAEAEVLEKLRHPSIVQLERPVSLGGLEGILMERAGEATLASRLREEGPLHLELLQRFGEDLLHAVNYLEEKGIPHRDLKPENIGIGQRGRDKALRLVLFDFSLSRTPTDNIRAGTPPYLDPFLTLRRPPRWDLAAERFAAAMTLYEMTTGTLPRWGDGVSDPASIDGEVTLQPELFPTDLRDGLMQFFEQALRRDPKQRFDNALEMQRAWTHLFLAAEGRPPAREEADSEALEAAIAQTTPDTQVILLGLSTRAANACDRANILTVQDLLEIPLTQIYSLRGVGQKTRREIGDLVRRLRRKPGLETIRPQLERKGPASDIEPETATVDQIVDQIARAGARSKDTNVPKILHALCGLESLERPAEEAWPTQSRVGERFGATSTQVFSALQVARRAWEKSPLLTSAREALARLLTSHGGVLTVEEAAAALVAALGSSQDPPLSVRLALAVVRAAVEVEKHQAEPRFTPRRRKERVLLGLTSELCAWAERLGEVADRLVEKDPLPTKASAVEELEAKLAPAEAPPISESRLIHLAAAASKDAAVSTRLELYPRGLSAVRTLRLSHGALLGCDALDEEALRSRVNGRYPLAEPLPSRPALDALLQEAGLDLSWDPSALAGAGGYVSTIKDTFTFTSDSTIVPTPRPPSETGREVAPEDVDQRLFEQKLRHAEKEGAFLVLTVEPKALTRAETLLRERFDLERHDLDELLITSMRSLAERAGADWEGTVLRADAAPEGSPDRRNLLQLVRQALSNVQERLAAPGKQTRLLVRPGLLARYDQLELIETLRDRVTHSGEVHGLWLLLPKDEQHALPTIDGKAVPVTSSAQWARIPVSWLTSDTAIAHTVDAPRSTR